MARDGREALQLIPKISPNVICTDLHMPNMDGLQLTREVMAERPIPILVISISVKEQWNERNIFELLEAGAIDVLPKPEGGLQGVDDKLVRELVGKVRILSGVVPIRRYRRKNIFRDSGEAATALPVCDIQSAVKMVAIGASTGGPQALSTIFSNLPASFPAPIICIQHISPDFIIDFVTWLDSNTTLTVRLAQEGEKPQSGNIYFPPMHRHLEIDSRGCFSLIENDSASIYCPSLDVTFKSIARRYGKSAIGVLLTGMGRDGAEGLKVMRDAGSVTVAEDEKSCVIFGMPQQAMKLGAVEKMLPVEGIASFLLQSVNCV